MSNFYNGNIKISIFGESHNKEMGVTIDGLKAGIKINYDLIDYNLSRRRPNELGTERRELDQYEIISGLFNGYTTSSPLTIIIHNNDIDDSSYYKGMCRPGQSDYTVYNKTFGFNDYRGGGAYSGRLTVLLVIVGSIFEDILNKKGIEVASHINELYGIKDRGFDFDNLDEDFKILKNNNTLSSYSKFEEKIKFAKENKDSIGGTIETVIKGIDDFIGDGFFDSVESKIASLAFSVPGVKGIEFGLGFGFKDKLGSEVVDEIENKEGKIKIGLNNGGINGGITNGMPIIFRTVIKPTSSIGIVQNTIDLESYENKKLVIEGRHDPCILPRALVVMNAIASIAIIDLFLSKYGYMWME